MQVQNGFIRDKERYVNSLEISASPIQNCALGKKICFNWSCAVVVLYGAVRKFYPKTSKGKEK